MAVDLYSRDLGGSGNPPLVILHGMLGSSRNWMGAGKDLTASFHVFALDLRNHGDSPHTDTASFKEMAEDLAVWVDRNLGSHPFFLLGHSLGGKVAMRYACQNPRSMRGLIVADMAPKPYALRYGDVFDALLSLELSKLESREVADSRLAEHLPEEGLRQFLLTNLTRDRGTQQFAWKCSLDAIAAHQEAWSENSLETSDRFEGPSLFIVGGQSPFVDPELDQGVIDHHFPVASVTTLPAAGHDVHIDDRAGFVDAVERFARDLR